MTLCKCTAFLFLGEMRDNLVWVRILSLLLAVSITPSLGLKFHVHPSFRTEFCEAISRRLLFLSRAGHRGYTDLQDTKTKAQSFKVTYWDLKDVFIFPYGFLPLNFRTNW